MPYRPEAYGRFGATCDERILRSDTVSFFSDRGAFSCAWLGTDAHWTANGAASKGKSGLDEARTRLPEGPSRRRGMPFAFGTRDAAAFSRWTDPTREIRSFYQIANGRPELVTGEST